jgi:hypothetical protein
LYHYFTFVTPCRFLNYPQQPPPQRMHEPSPPQIHGSLLQHQQQQGVAVDNEAATDVPVQMLERMRLNVTTTTAEGPVAMTAERPRTASSHVPLSSAMPATSASERQMLQQRAGTQLQRTSTAPSSKTPDVPEVGPEDKENSGSGAGVGGGGGGGVAGASGPSKLTSREAEDDVHETKEGLVGGEPPQVPVADDGKGNGSSSSATAEQSASGHTKSFLMATMARSSCA